MALRPSHQGVGARHRLAPTGCSGPRDSPGAAICGQGTALPLPSYGAEWQSNVNVQPKCRNNPLCLPRICVGDRIGRPYNRQSRIFGNGSQISWMQLAENISPVTGEAPPRPYSAQRVTNSTLTAPTFGRPGRSPLQSADADLWQWFADFTGAARSKHFPCRGETPSRPPSAQRVTNSTHTAPTFSPHGQGYVSTLPNNPLWLSTTPVGDRIGRPYNRHIVDLCWQLPDFTTVGICGRGYASPLRWAAERGDGRSALIAPLLCRAWLGEKESLHFYHFAKCTVALD